MKTIYTIKEVRNEVSMWKKKGLKVGFVPTMGYLHEGHGSLIKKAYEECDKVIVSTFVNPIQFGVNEDLDKYPRNQKQDEEIIKKNGGHIMFLPSVEEMYPEERKTTVAIEGLTKGLCGEKRPGHFNGVTTVVSKLFNIVLPDKAYFGEKDAQQLAVIKKMVKDLNFPIEIIGCPIIREKDGLAKSSRNKYLNIEERKAAIVLSKSLNLGKELLIKGENSAENIKIKIKEEIKKEALAKIDYIEVVDLDSLESVDNIENNILVAIAVFIGKTRLIDNFMWINQ